MTNQTTSFKNIASKLMLCAMLLLVLAGKVNAQVNTAFTASLLNDSLVASNNKDFLYNNLTVTNTSSDKLSMIITITAPNKWQSITDNVITINLDRNASTIVPIRLLPGTGNTATWQQVKIEYRVLNTNTIKNDFFNVRVQQFSKFRATLLNPNLVMPSFQKLVSVPVYIKNAGNTAGTYTIKCSNEFLHLDNKETINVEAGADSTYLISLALTENEFAAMKKEEIKVAVTCNDETYNLSQTISKIGYVVAEHSSAYAEMPLQLEAGAIYQGTTVAPQFYGGLYGSVDLTQQDRISVALRSNTISGNQSIDNGAMQANYTGAHIQASIGNVMEMNDFAMNGYGGKFAYNWNNNDKVTLYSQLISKTGSSNIYGGSFQHIVNNKIKVTESVATDLDKTNKLNSTVAKQKADVKLNEKTKLSVITGAGMEQSTAQIVNGRNVLVGSTFGYDFQYLGKNVNVLSNVLYNSNNFAGIYKGQKNQTHDVRIIKNKFFFGGYYEYSYSKQTNFSDSILVNSFNMQTNNYGVRAGWSGKQGNVVLSAGNQKQIQAGEGNNFQTSYNYLNLNSTIYLAKKVSLMVNSYAGQGAVASQNVKNVFITSTQGTLQVYNSGVIFRYDQGPFYYSDFATYIQHPQKVERCMVSPYIDLNLFKSAFSMRAQYNYTAQTDGATAVSTVMVNLAYNNAAKGYDFHVTGMIPTKQENNIQPYLSATLRVRLNAHCIAVRKYYTAKIFLFEDENNNGIMDKGEAPIAGQTVSINGNLFISDADGMIVYKNADNGVYNANFGLSSKIKGWAPATGSIQKIEIDGSNTTQYVAFRKSHVLQGSLKVVSDSNSNLKFTVANIKVVVTTNDSTTYSTLTNEDGEFYLNLPAGNYTVSLSPSAFDEHFHPTQYAQTADLVNNQTKNVYFEIRQKKREINIKKN